MPSMKQRRQSSYMAFHMLISNAWSWMMEEEVSAELVLVLLTFLLLSLDLSQFLEILPPLLLLLGSIKSLDVYLNDVVEFMAVVWELMTLRDVDSSFSSSG